MPSGPVWQGEGGRRIIFAMKPSDALQAHRSAVLRIATDMGARNIRVFGSVLRGEDTETSDVDLLVDMPRGTTLLNMVRMQNALEDEMGVAVDVLTALDLPLAVREEVIREARAL